jgi:hypothetical protein
MVKKWKLIRIEEETYNKLRKFAVKDSFSDAIRILLFKKEMVSALPKKKREKLARERRKPDCFGTFKTTSGLCADCLNKDECRVFTE